jgi:hypothetical protein
MAINKFKIEGGQGGKRGHSNMAHWVSTAELKEAARKNRRAQSRKIIRDELDERAGRAPASRRKKL